MPGSRVAVLQTAAFDSMLLARVAVAGGARIRCERVFPSSRSAAERMQLIAVRAGSLHRTEADSHEQLSVETDQALLVLDPGYEVRALQGCELLLIDAPIELAQQVMGQDFERGVTLLDGSSQLLHPTVAFAAQLLRSDREVDPSNLGTYYIERLLQEMLIGLIVDGLIDSRRRSAAPTAPDLYRLALSVIQVRSTDSRLTTDVVAEEVHLSRRQLERLFQKNGTSVAAEVRRTRVMQAVSMLQDPQYTALSVDQIGQFVGLSGGSSLARMMSAEGLDSPARVRRRAGSTV